MGTEDGGTAGKALTRFLKIKNVSHVLQVVGRLEWRPGEVCEVTATQAERLVKKPQFEYAGDEPVGRARPGSGAHPLALLPSPKGQFVADVCKALQPDPPSPQWITEYNRNVFPCQTDEFEPIKKAEKTFSVTFRLHGLTELNGGVRVILRMAGYLAARGHDVALSTSVTSLVPANLDGLPVTLCSGIPDSTFIVGTYWPTIHEVVTSPAKGKRVAFVQSDEPSWFNEKEAAQKEHSIRAFCYPNMDYIAVSRQVAKACKRKYGTEIIGDLGGNGVDGLDFSPRRNDHDVRNGVCGIYRGAWFKNDDFVFGLMRELRKRRPETKTKMAGFARVSNPAVDEFLCNPSVDEMALMYSNADFYLSGSRIEGSPLPPLEAAACGCVPIVTRIGTEEWLEDGVNGLVIEADKPQEALERILAVYADDKLRRDLLRNAIRTARGRPWSKVCEQFEAFLVEIGGAA